MNITFYVDAYAARKHDLLSKLSFLRPEIYRQGTWNNEGTEVFCYIARAKEPRQFDGDAFYYPEFDLRFVGEAALGFESRDALMRLNYIVNLLAENHIACKLQVKT